MKKIAQLVAAATVAALALACTDTTGPSSTESALALSQAFATLPAGFTLTTNSFASNDNVGDAFLPHMGGGPGGPRGDRGERGGLDRIDGHGMMGGLGPDFFGGIGFGRGFGHGPFGGINLRGTCAFSSSNGRVECNDTHDGLTIVASASYKTASGAVQQAPDSTTDVANIQTTVTGTVTRRDSAVSTVNHTSNRTVTGLAVGSTQRTVNGTARGEESTTGKTDLGAVFTAVRLVGDTATGLVIPIQSGKPTYPTAGRVVRQMKATVTVSGTTTTRERREVITYDGSATATLVITTDGTTKTCTIPLPRGVPSCS